MARKKSPSPQTYGTDLSSAEADTRADAEGKATKKGLSAKFWHDEIKASEKREEKWRKRGKKVVDRYRDDRDKDDTADRRTNILWSNTELLKAVLFQEIGNPDVRRRYPKKGKDERASRTAALSLERSLSYCADAYDSHAQMECALEDMLLPGRGQAWIVYDAKVEEQASEEDEDQTEAVSISDQEVRAEHVYWEDYRTSAGRKEADIWWKGRRHQYTRDELKNYFPEHAKQIPLEAEIADAPKLNKDESETFKRANVWEIWDKTKKERVYVAEGYPTILKKDEDPYNLKSFFPCPPALYGVKTTSSLTPVPEFTLYQDQCEELDQITTRLNRLIDALKRRGVYDASAEGPDNQLSQLAHAGDNEFIPYKGFAVLMEKGGLQGVFQTEDLAPIIQVVQELYQQRQTLIQTIYEVTGISDVIRGASDPNETATAQRIKGQFGSLRIQKRQKKVQHFIRDLFRLKAEIIAEHFTREKIVEMTGIDMPLQMEIEQAKQNLAQLQQMQQQAAQQAQMAQQAASQAMSQLPAGASQFPAMQQPLPPPPMPSPEQVQDWQETAKAVSWEQISAILRSDQRRGYKVEIETDDTNKVDDTEEKASRIEFMTTMQGLLERALPMAMQSPALVPLVKETVMFTVKAFKVGRSLEESYEEAFSALEAQAKQAAEAGPPQDPKLAAEAEKIKADMQITQQQAQAQKERQSADLKFAGETHLADMQMKGVELKLKEADLAMRAQQMDFQFLEGQMGIAEKEVEQQREAQTHEINIEGARADQEMKAGAAEVKMAGAKSDQEMKAKTAEAKINGSVPSVQQSAQPQTSGLQQALMQMAQAITEMSRTNQMVLQAVTAPRTVRIVRDAAGKAAGAVQQIMDFNAPVAGNA